MLVLPVLIPILFGVVLLIMREPKNRTALLAVTGIGLAVSSLSAVYALFTMEGREQQLFLLMENLPVTFRLDRLGMLFAALVTVAWLCAGVYSFGYMKHEQKEKRYYGYYLIVNGILLALCFSGNLITFYLFYELLTLCSLPLVLHTGAREAIMAGLKYLFYSLCGAYMALFGLFFLNHAVTTFDFIPGGTLDGALVQGNEEVLLTAAFLMILGFGVKAGMFPLHAWLPAAHPVAPGPASAVLSSVIVKAGVLGIIRSVYYIFGAGFLRGSWVQTVWLTLSLLTVFMGSMLAYREKGLKKRLAYSTVSQVSYILFGLALFNPAALTGSLLHAVFHGLIKCALFLAAGAVIYSTGKRNVDGLRGIGKQMPVTIWCFTFASLALIGIPPASGFVSKWYLASGALDSNLAVFSWLGPVILLASALLTAGYLLPVTMKGFFPGADYRHDGKKAEPPSVMTFTILILTVLAVALGMVPNPLINWLSDIVSAVL